MGPNAPLIGAVVEVRDRDGRLLDSGTVNQGGVMILRDIALRAEALPLSLTSTGGTARGQDFNGILKTYAWPKTRGATSVYLDLVTTAATRKEVLAKDVVPTQRSWRDAVGKVRAAIGIPGDAPDRILATGNNYVDFDRILASSAPERRKAPRTYNGLVSVLAKSAAAGRQFARVNPRGSTNPMASAPFSPIASSSPTCTSNLPNSSGPGSPSTEIVVNLGIIASASYLEVAGVPSTLTGGIAGMLLGGLSATGTSPELSAIEAVAEQLECISAQLDSLKSAVALQAAESCESAVRTAFGTYQDLVADAQPLQLTGVTGAAGSTVITLPGTTGYGTLIAGQTVVTGPGIGQQVLEVPDATGSAGVRTLTIPRVDDSIKRGMKVTGAGIGSTDDTPVTVVSIASDGLSSSVLTLSATNTGSVAGVSLEGPVRITSKYVEGGNTVIALSTETKDSIEDDLTFTLPLDYSNVALATLMDDVSRLDCNNIISKSIFESPTGTSEPSVYNDLVAGNIDNGAHIGVGGVQTIQQFLGAWSIVMYQQSILEGERYNYLGDIQTRVNKMGIDEVTGKCKSGATWLDTTFCVYTSNFAQATPPDMYSNELGLTHSAGNGSAIIAAPLGHMLPGMNPDLNNCHLDSLSDHKEGYQTAGLPVYWYFCQKKSQTDSVTISNFKDKQQDFFNAAQRIALNDDPNNSAVSTFYAPRVRHGDWPTGDDIKPIGDSGKEALRTLVVQEGLVLDASTTSDSDSRFYGTSFYTNGSRSPANTYRPKDVTYPGDPYTLVDFKAEIGSDSSYKVYDKNDLPDLVLNNVRYHKLGCPCMMQILTRPWWPQAVAGGISAWTATTVKPLNPAAAGY